MDALVDERSEHAGAAVVRQPEELQIYRSISLLDTLALCRRRRGPARSPFSVRMGLHPLPVFFRQNEVLHHHQSRWRGASPYMDRPRLMIMLLGNTGAGKTQASLYWDARQFETEPPTIGGCNLASINQVQFGEETLKAALGSPGLPCFCRSEKGTRTC